MVSENVCPSLAKNSVGNLEVAGMWKNDWHIGYSL